MRCPVADTGTQRSCEVLILVCVVLSAYGPTGLITKSGRCQKIRNRQGHYNKSEDPFGSSAVNVTAPVQQLVERRISEKILSR